MCLDRDAKVYEDTSKLFLGGNRRTSQLQLPCLRLFDVASKGPWHDPTTENKRQRRDWD